MVGIFDFAQHGGFLSFLHFGHSWCWGIVAWRVWVFGGRLKHDGLVMKSSFLERSLSFGGRISGSVFSVRKGNGIMWEIGFEFGEFSFEVELLNERIDVFVGLKVSCGFGKEATAEIDFSDKVCVLIFGWEINLIGRMFWLLHNSFYRKYKFELLFLYSELFFGLFKYWYYLWKLFLLTGNLLFRWVVSF